MAEIEITATRPNPVGGRRAGQQSLWSRQTELNDTLARILVGILFLVPIPLGSNRPVFWAVTAVLVGIASIYYLRAHGRIGEKFRYGFRHLIPSTGLVLLLFAYLALQVVPLGLLGQFAEPFLKQLTIVTQSGEVIEPLAISLAPGATLLMLLRLATYALVFFMVLQIGTNYLRKIFILNALLAIIALHAIFGLAALIQFGDTLLGMPKTAYEGSATGTFVNRNSFATFLAFGAVIAVALAAGKLTESREEGDRRRFDPIVLIYFVALATTMSTLLATQSRMGLFAAIVGCSSVMLVAMFRAGNILGRLLGLLPVLALALGVGFYVYGQGVLERLGSLESAADVRMDLYTQVVEMIAARPWFGYGGGAFEVAFPLFHRPPVSVDLLWDHTHNTYLALWVELGLIFGSIPLLLLAGATIRIVWGLTKSRADWTAKVAALGVIVTAAIHSLADFSLEIQANAMFFVALVALGVSGVARSTRP